MKIITSANVPTAVYAHEIGGNWSSMNISESIKMICGMKKCGCGEKRIYQVLLLFEDLRCLSVENIDRFQKALFENIADNEQCLDHWAEGKAALTLASNGFQVVYEPFGRPGPDLSASCSGYRFYVEVSRFREDYETSQKLSQKLEECNGTLVEYGRGEKDVERVYGKIMSKAKQLPENETGLVFLQSDNDRIEEIEFEEVTPYFDRLVSEQNLLTKLGGVLFDSGWVKFPTREHFYLWRNPKAEKPINDLLAGKLQRLKEPPTHSRDELSELKHRFHISE